jgi:IS5 family transposase
MRGFIGIDLALESVPDATMLLKFRRLLKAHQLTEAIFREINAHLSERGLLLREGTMMDAPIIEALLSTKNEAKAHGAEMYPTKKGMRDTSACRRASARPPTRDCIPSATCDSPQIRTHRAVD